MVDLVEQILANIDGVNPDTLKTRLRWASNEIDGLRKWNAWFAAHNTEWKTKNIRLQDRLETATDLLRDALNVIGVQNDWTVPYQRIRKFIDETDDAAPTT